MYVYVQKLSAVYTQQHTKKKNNKKKNATLFLSNCSLCLCSCLCICVVVFSGRSYRLSFIFSFLFHITLFFKSSHKIALARAALWVDISSRQIAQKAQFIAATGTFVLSISAKVNAGFFLVLDLSNADILPTLHKLNLLHWANVYVCVVPLSDLILCTKKIFTCLTKDFFSSSIRCLFFSLAFFCVL